MLLFIPFLALDDKGGVKGHLCTHLGMCRPCIPLFRTHVVLFTFWTSLILCKDYVVWETCIVCYSVFSYRTWVYSKKFLLVCVLFELTDCCFSVFWFRRAGYSGIQAGFSGFLIRSLWAYTRSLRVQLTDTHFIEWITCHMHHTYSWHSPIHPTVKLLRVFVFLSINMPIVDMSSQNWNSKFMAYI